MNGHATSQTASPFNLRDALARFERGFLQNALQLTQGDRETAAQLLEITPEELAQKLRALATHAPLLLHSSEKELP